MSDTHVPGVIVPLQGNQEPIIKYLPPTDASGSRIADALEKIAETLGEISAKLDARPVASQIHSDVPAIDQEQYMIYVTSQHIKDDMYITGCYLYRGLKRINEWFPAHKREPLHGMLLSVYTAVNSLVLATPTDLPVIVGSNFLDILDTLKYRKQHADLVCDIHRTAEKQSALEVRHTMNYPLQETLCKETIKIKEKICSQLQAQESSTQT